MLIIVVALRRLYLFSLVMTPACAPDPEKALGAGRSSASTVGAWSLVPLLALAASLEAQPIGSEFRVNTTTVGIQSRASIASASNGAFTIVWSTYPLASQTGVEAAVVGQRFDAAGMPAGGEFRVDTGSFAWWPAIASDPSGNFVVVYVEHPKTTSDIFGQRFSASGTPLGPEFRVNTYTTGLQGRPTAARADDGKFVVV